MNLHDWIDELCHALDIKTEFDEGLAAVSLAEMWGVAGADLDGPPEAADVEDLDDELVDVD